LVFTGLKTHKNEQKAAKDVTNVNEDMDSRGKLYEDIQDKIIAKTESKEAWSTAELNELFDKTSLLTYALGVRMVQLPFFSTHKSVINPCGRCHPEHYRFRYGFPDLYIPAIANRHCTFCECRYCLCDACFSRNDKPDQLITWRHIQQEIFYTEPPGPKQPREYRGHCGCVYFDRKSTPRYEELMPGTHYEFVDFPNVYITEEPRHEFLAKKYADVEASRQAQKAETTRILINHLKIPEAIVRLKIMPFVLQRKNSELPDWDICQCVNAKYLTNPKKFPPHLRIPIKSGHRSSRSR
jgi:hypothetical protein